MHTYLVGIDVLLVPTVPSTPFVLSSHIADPDPVDCYVHDVMTVPANLAGRQIALHISHFP